MKLAEDRRYQADYCAWIQEEQVAVLRCLATSRAPSDIDLGNLAEEGEDLGSSERRAVRSQLRRLPEHLQKLEHGGSQTPKTGWLRTILDARIELEDDLAPTLRQDLDADLQTHLCILR